ncbi:MAG: DNA polymerase III subunit delta [Gemmataceae bacterium]|nr:DNA polymerase III subunit delta [Gemmataceae bacterium]
MDALQFLAAKDDRRYPVYALVGDEDFLKRHARQRIIDLAIGDEDPTFAVSVSAGDKIDFSTARNELETLPFLAPCRVLIVEAADTFVTENRTALEAYCAKPSAVGVLVLDVKSLPENTKLARAINADAKIVCKSPRPYDALKELSPWCVRWAQSTYKKKLASDGAQLLVELVGTSMGLLDQELAKLAVAVGSKPHITAEDVDVFVGRSRAADPFRILDAIGAGKPAEALSILEESLAEGEDPMGILARLTSQLRNLATVARLVHEGQTLGAAMDAARVPTPTGIRQSVERQLRHLGRRRLAQLPDWLVEINHGLKGGNPLPERVQLERLIVMLARPRDEAKK